MLANGSNVHQPPAPSSCSTAQAAQMMGVSAPTIRRWVDQGRLRAWKTVGGHRRIDLADLHRLLNSLRAASSQAPVGGHLPRSVLIVEDNDNDRLLLVALTESIWPDAAIQVSHNGMHALSLLRTWTPDILLTDVLMPRMGGIELLQACQRHGGTLPKLTATATGLNREALEAMGGLPQRVLFIAKPLDTVQATVALRSAWQQVG